MNIPEVSKYLGKLIDLLNLLDSLYKIAPKYIYYSEMESDLRFRSESEFCRTKGQIFRYISKDDLLESSARGNTEPLRNYVSHFEKEFESIDKDEPSPYKLYDVFVTLNNLFDTLDDLRIWIEVYSRKSNILEEKYNLLIIPGEFGPRGDDIKTILGALTHEEEES